MKFEVIDNQEINKQQKLKNEGLTISLNTNNKYSIHCDEGYFCDIRDSITNNKEWADKICKLLNKTYGKETS